MTLLTLALIALSPVAPVAPREQGAAEFAQLSFRSHTVVRVQTTQLEMVPLAALKEKKGPKCVAMGDILAAAVLARSSVDLVLRGGYRIRARFSANCPGLDYYSGFYLVPSSDGKLCADRDVIRDRAGGECEIDKFRQLVEAH
ncbi:MAG TPA: hypothetical protein VK533_08180 [Sphingomonas sp.]|uniref:hypothetical protein n=1 Tax=Sphingomonas sp. TaxID=28214 RepID=UPI002C1CB138|nr:hypothetical protein [Sphingomonas sp.]HMI19506.1 hypothetical protein [Sphingomonas sp.]